MGIAARLAGAIGSADESLAATPRELTGTIARAYEVAVARTRAALGEPAFMDDGDAGRHMTREEVIELALA